MDAAFSLRPSSSRTTEETLAPPPRGGDSPPVILRPHLSSRPPWPGFADRRQRTPVSEEPAHPPCGVRPIERSRDIRRRAAAFCFSPGVELSNILPAPHLRPIQCGMGYLGRWPDIQTEYWSAVARIFNALENKDGHAALEALRAGLNARTAAANDARNCWWQVAGCVLERTDIGPYDLFHRGFAEVIRSYTLFEPRHWALAAVYGDRECLVLLETLAAGQYPDGEGPGVSSAYRSVADRVRQAVASDGYADLHELYRRFNSRDRARLKEIWKLVLLPGDAFAGDRSETRIIRGPPPTRASSLER